MAALTATREMEPGEEVTVQNNPSPQWEERPWKKSVRVVGDNLQAVRYGAAASRFRRLALQGPIDDGILAAASLGWTMDWQAVRRRCGGVT